MSSVKNSSQVVPLQPLGLDKLGIRLFIGIGPKVLSRMIWASRHATTGEKWLQFSSNHEGRPRLRVTFSVASAERAFARLKAGEEPPLLPCELRARASQSTKKGVCHA